VAAQSGAVADHVGVAEVAGWAAGLEKVHERIPSRFSRSEPRERVVAYLRGLLAPLERKNGWTLAELAGERSRRANHPSSGIIRLSDRFEKRQVDQLGRPCHDETSGSRPQPAVS